MYVGEQYWMVRVQAIEIIEHKRTVADSEEPVIWPIKAETGVRFPRQGNPTRPVRVAARPCLHLPFDKFLRLGGRSEEISQIWIVWGKAVAVSRYHPFSREFAAPK